MVQFLQYNKPNPQAHFHKCSIKSLIKQVLRDTIFLAANVLLVPWTGNHLSSFKCGFLNIFRAKTCCAVCHAYCFCYGGTNMARRNVWKPHFIRLLRWFNLSQSESRKNNRKAFEGASVEPTMSRCNVWHVSCNFWRIPFPSVARQVVRKPTSCGTSFSKQTTKKLTRKQAKFPLYSINIFVLFQKVYHDFKHMLLSTKSTIGFVVQM